MDHIYIIVEDGMVQGVYGTLDTDRTVVDIIDMDCQDLTAVQEKSLKRRRKFAERQNNLLYFERRPAHECE